MLAGLVRNELNRQTTALVQRLQDNISEEIPMLVDDVLQENLLNVLNEIKQSQSQWAIVTWMSCFIVMLVAYDLN